MCGLKGRGRRHSVAIPGGNFIVIDESYNASPVSMQATIEVLGRMQPEGQGRRIAVLGDMLELGDQSATHHAALADFLIAEKINRRHLVADLRPLPIFRREIVVVVFLKIDAETMCPE